MKRLNPVYRGTLVADMDGVISDFESEFCDAFGRDNRHLYSLEARYPDLDPLLIKEFVSNPEVYSRVSPIFGGALLLRQAYLRGWYILILTSRDKSMREVTRSWLSNYGITYHELAFSRNKRAYVEDYDAIHPSRKAKIVVDDSVSVLAQFQDRLAVAWAQPWNYGYQYRMEYDSEEMKIFLQEVDKDGKLLSDKWIWEKAK